MQINTAILLAGFHRPVAHAALANDPAHTKVMDDLALVWLLPDRRRRPGRRAFPGTVVLFHHHRAAMINNAILETHPRRQFATVMQILVHRITAGEYRAGNQHLIAHFKGADFFFGKGKR